MFLPQPFPNLLLRDCVSVFYSSIHLVLSSSSKIYLKPRMAMLCSYDTSLKFLDAFCSLKFLDIAPSFKIYRYFQFHLFSTLSFSFFPLRGRSSKGNPLTRDLLLFLKLSISFSTLPNPFSFSFTFTSISLRTLFALFLHLI